MAGGKQKKQSGQKRKQPEQSRPGSQAPDKPEAYGVPQAPSIQKRWVFHKVQKLGVPLLILIPLLAIFGVFGETFETVAATGDTFAVEVNYPARYRYKMVNPMTVVVENISAQTVPTATVAFDEGYISQFSTVSFTPSPAEVTADAYYVQLHDVRAGEVRQIVVNLQAEQYWLHRGMVAVAAGGVDAEEDVAVEVTTLVYP